MEIIVGKYAGFCNGAKNAVNKTMDLLDGKDVYSVGEIVHNEVVIEELKKKGLIVKDNIDEIPNNSKIIIRAHGETLDFYGQAKKKKLDVIDLTCGRVKVVHNKILSKKNNFVIIIGKKNHPETIAHKSYSDSGYVIENIDDVVDAYNNYLSSDKKNVYVVAQTTFNSKLFDEIVEKIKEVFKIDIEVDKTICNATSIRQEEAKEIASNVDKMIIIGGKNSSNTKELEVASCECCPKTYLIQTKDDLNGDIFDKDDIVGITAGASTPEKTIVEVVEYLNNIYNKRK